MIQDLAAARQAIAQREQALREAGVEFRSPPAEPTTCCGRGCNGCEWEGYYAAVGWWLEEAGQRMAIHQLPGRQVGGTEFS